jgi:transforming growth factor-beta-induced protein
MLAAMCSAAIGVGIVSPLPQRSAMAADDKMMMQKKDIIDTAVGPGMQEVTTVVKAIQAADLVETLKGKGPFTVFAPTNAAFDKLPKGTLDDLLKPENKDKLKGILLYHVHAGDAIMAKDVKTMKLSTAQGKDLDVKAEGGTVMINNAKVIKTDVVCSNGVIHWIDTVVMPPEK